MIWLMIFIFLFYQILLNIGGCLDFFTSSSLAISAQGTTKLINNNGKMKLLCSAKLNEDDFKVILESNTDPIKFIENSFLEDLNSLEEGFIKDYVEVLGWMIAKGHLEIKIAIPENNKGNVSFKNRYFKGFK